MRVEIAQAALGLSTVLLWSYKSEGDTSAKLRGESRPSLCGASSQRQAPLQKFGGESSEMIQLLLLPLVSGAKV